MSVDQEAPFGGKPFRVRRIFIKAEIEIQDGGGRLEHVGLTDEIVMPEAHFAGQPGLVAYLCARVPIAAGFAVAMSEDGPKVKQGYDPIEAQEG